MKVRYIGPEPTTCYGQSFTPGQLVEIDDRFADKARGNPFFEVVESEGVGNRELGVGNSEVTLLPESDKPARKTKTRKG